MQASQASNPWVINNQSSVFVWAPTVLIELHNTGEHDFST